MITETIRGMNYVSPLATMKFINRSPDDILNIYFPAAKITTVKKTDIVIDKDCPIKPEDFIVKKFGTDTDGDGTGDSFAFYLALFISNDGLKVREAYECTTPREDELVLFVENNENDVSNQVLFAKIHPELRKKFTMQNGSLNPNLFDEDILKVVNENGGGISLEILEELVVNGKIEEKIIPLKMALNGINYLLYAMTAPAKAVGWLCRKAGEGIDMLKISDEFWDTQSEEYFLKKENVIKSLQVDAAILDRWYARFQDDPEKLEWNDLLPGFVKEKTKNAYEDLKAYAHKYNQFVESNIDALYAQVNKTGVVDLLKIKENTALYCGMWNGLVDFVSSIFHFASMLLEAPFDMAPDMEYMLEIYDNCAEVFRKMDFAQIAVMLTGMYEEIKKHFKEKDGEDYDLVRIAYCIGFLLIFIATFFIPYAALLKIANIGKVGKTGEILTKFMNEVGGTYTKSVNFIEQKSSAALKSSLKSLQGMLDLFSDVKKLKAFLERVWKTISDWFLKNKKLFGKIDKVDDSLVSSVRILKLKIAYRESLSYIKLIKRPLGKWLALEQEAAVNLYTKSYYILFNKALRKIGGARMTREFKAMQKILDDALDKLPVSSHNDNVLLKSNFFTEDQIRKLFKVGEDFTEKGFMSTTYSEEALLRWMRRSPADNTIFKVYGKNGKLIEASSQSPHEAEVLFKSGTTFVVESVKPGKNPINELEQITIIVLKEK